MTKAAACEEKGETTYTARFTKEAFTVQTKTVADIPATGHAWGEATYEWAADNNTVTATRVCLNDSSHVETETVNTTEDVLIAPTCETAGKSNFTAAFKNGAFTAQTKTNVDVPAFGHDWGEWTVTTPATCTEEGVETRICSHDAAHTETRVIDALGHDWSEPTYTWADDCSTVTAERHCQRAGCSHSETETVSTTPKVTKAAACEEKGETTYTAVFANSTFGTKMKTVANIPATGHDWGEATYKWSADNSSVTATRVCGHDATHKETETVKTTAKVTKAATCEEKGKTTYTAIFKNTAFSTQTKTVEVPATGHDWGEPTWTWDGTDKVTAKFVCSIDKTVYEAKGTIASEVVTEAGRHTDGSRTYTASVTGPDGKVYTTDPSDAKTETIPATHRVRKSKKDKSGSTLQIDVETDTLNVKVSGDGVTADTPALVASYDEDGRFMGLAPVTAPTKDPIEMPEEASTVKVLWIDEKFAPKSESEEIVREE